MNNKLREAAEKLIKDKKKGRNYGSNIAGPQVDVAAIAERKIEETGMGLEIKVELLAGVENEKNIAGKKSEKNEKTKKSKKTCKYCHIVGHERKTNKDCLLTTNKAGKYYKPENNRALCKFSNR